MILPQLRFWTDAVNEVLSMTAQKEAWSVSTVIVFASREVNAYFNMNMPLI